MSTIHVVWACCVCVFSRNLQMTYGLFKGHWQKIISGRVVFLVVTDRFSTRVEKKSEMRKKGPWKTITVSCLMPLHFPSEKKLREERGRRGFISWDKISVMGRKSYRRIWIFYFKIVDCPRVNCTTTWSLTRCHSLLIAFFLHISLVPITGFVLNYML